MIQLHNVDLKLLRVFDAVVRCGGLSAAQAELNVGQSTISAQIGQLEVRLGVRLCDRGRGGFRLTEQGRAVHDATQRLMSAIENFRIEADQLKRSVAGTLSLGVIDNTVTDRGSPLRGAVSRFLARGPDVHIDVYVGNPSELEQRVLDGRVHVAIGHFPFPVHGIASVPLYEEVHGLFCGAQDPLAAPSWSDEALAVRLRRARVVARGYLRRSDLDLIGASVAASTTDSVEAQAILILAGGCVGFLPLHYATQWIDAGELLQLMPERMILTSPFSAIMRRMPLPPLLRCFIDDLESTRRS